ncbi:unnamed protein product [Owenia fusiformis]|uniref:Uncharacterized protein n=1 Tax=Owenia fusiformis TaxID=6347 RepID=A0A8J1UKC2_OWEFU|nr:unnamed protein product [Owenia fusiformis]
MQFFFDICLFEQCLFVVIFILTSHSVAESESSTIVHDVTVSMVTGSLADVEDVTISAITAEVPVTEESISYSACDTAGQVCDGRCGHKGNASIGRCQCDPLCTTYGDCCPDFKMCVRVDILKQGRAGVAPELDSMTHQGGTFECVAINRSKNVYMKAKCDSRFIDNDVIDLCVQESRRVDTKIPVTDSSDGNIYRNIYCAKCNFATELQFWNMSLHCDVREYQNISIFNADMFETYPNQECALEYTAPHVDDTDVRECRRVISDCDSCEENQVALCNTYGLEPMVDPHTGLVYRNKHCMNTSQVAAIKSCDQIEQSKIIQDIVWYDINVVSEGNGSMLLSVAIEGVSTHSDEDQMIFQYFLAEQGEFVSCPSRYDLVDGECVTDGALFLFNITSVMYRFVSGAVISMDSYNSRLTDTLQQFLTVIGNMNIITEQFIWNFSPFKIDQNNVFHVYFPAYTSSDAIMEAFQTITDNIFGLQLEMSGNKSTMKLSISYMFIYGVYGVSNVTAAEGWTSDSIRGLVTLTCLIVSSTLLIIRIVLQAFIPVFHNHHGKVQCCLTGSILAANVSFLMRGVYLVASVPWVCATMAIITHWFYLHMFTWMQVATYDIYTKFSKSFANLVIQKQDLGYRGVVYAITIPSVIVTSAVIVDFVLPEDSRFSPKYGTELCWISQQYALIIFFIAPMTLILIGNTAMFFVTVQAIFRNGNNLLTPNIQQRKAHMIGVYLRPLTMVGLTWFIGILANVISVDPVWYLYIVLNALQGAFLVLSALCSRRVVDSNSKSKRQATTHFPSSSSSQLSIFSFKL